MEHRRLWRDAFSDTERYMDFYFGNKVYISKVYSRYEGDKLASMAFCTPHHTSFFGIEEDLSYIVGVATDVAYRKQGRMRELLIESMMEGISAGQSMIYLSPANENYYKGLGFVGMYDRHPVVVEDFSPSSLTVKSYGKLSVEKRKEVVRFVNYKLESSDKNFFVKRSLGYYDLLQKEMQSLLGDVLVFYNEESQIIGSAWLGAEEGKAEVYELVCSEQYTKEMIDAVWHYIKEHAELEEEKLTVFDTEFLPNDFKGKKEDKSYIMGRILDMNHFLDKIPEKVLREAFGVENGSVMELKVKDSILPQNNGIYCIGEKGDRLRLSLTIEEVEKRIFPLLNAYINDIT